MMAVERVERRLAAIMAADVVGYSRLMELDERGTLTQLQSLRREVIDPAIAEYSGRMVKLMGDGALVEFASAVDAVTCAIEIQRRVEEVNPDRGRADRIRFRIGINVGDIIVDDNDIYGDGVNVAARIEAMADPGTVFISRSVADQVREKIANRLESRGVHSVKNISRPIEVYCVCADVAGVAEPEGRDVDRAPATPTHRDKPSIAVLAFNNMSGDPEQEYFSDGISEDIITDLSKLAQLHVIARNSSFVYKGGAVSIPSVAQELGVRYVLEGSVRKAGNRVRVTAQLIDSDHGGHVWADRLDRDMTDIFEVQDEVTRHIVSALKVRLSRDDEDRLARRAAVNAEAYNLFMRGREQTWQHSRTGNIEGRRLLARATEITPEFAAAHARIAFTHVIDYVNGWTVDPEATLRQGRDLAQRAVEMDSEDPQTHFALSAVLLWSGELEQAADEAARCIELEPNSAEGHLVQAHTLIFAGQPEAAIDAISAYMKLDPLYPDIVLHFLAEAHISLRKFEEAVAILMERLERRSDSPTSLTLLASCYGHLGRHDESRAAWAEALRIDPQFSLERRRRILPFKNPGDFELRMDGLRLSGAVPDGTAS